MSHIRYTGQTHEYYIRKGSTNAYRYAHHTEGPFQRPLKPVAASRPVLISSAGFVIVPDDGAPLARFRSTNTSRADGPEVFDVPGDIPADRIACVTGAHNRQDSPMDAVDASLPLTRLRELWDAGRIGGLAGALGGGRAIVFVWRIANPVRNFRPGPQ